MISGDLFDGLGKEKVGWWLYDRRDGRVYDLEGGYTPSASVRRFGYDF